MTENRELGFAEMMSIARRRIWWIILPVLIGPVLALGVASLLPPRYRSQSLVLVEQQQVPDRYVTPVITEQLNTRLATLQEQILSRSRLQPIIERFDLYQQDRTKMPMDELVERLRKGIEVTPIRPQAGTSGTPGFYVAVTADKARTAQLVCGEILSMVMADNVRSRAQQAQGTTEFLTAQLNEAKAALDRQEAALAQFQRQHLGQLPSDQQQNTQMLASLGGQLESVNQALAQAQQQKVLQESLISQQTAALNSAPSNAVSPADLQRDISNLQTQLADLEARYTQNHPDVRKLKAQIEQLKGDLRQSKANSEGSTNHSAVEPPELVQLRAALRGTEMTINSRVKEQERLTNEIKKYQARLQITPLVDEQYKKLTRDHETALQFYNDLLSKKSQSEMATDLERRQQGEQFRVMDAPDLPGRPSFPNRIQFGFGGVGAGLALGIGMVVLLESRKRCFWSIEDVETLLHVSVLVCIPELRVRPGRSRAILASAARRKPEGTVAGASS